MRSSYSHDGNQVLSCTKVRSSTTPQDEPQRPNASWLRVCRYLLLRGRQCYWAKVAKVTRMATSQIGYNKWMNTMSSTHACDLPPTPILLFSKLGECCAAEAHRVHTNGSGVYSSFPRRNDLISYSFLEYLLPYTSNAYQDKRDELTSLTTRAVGP